MYKRAVIFILSLLISSNSFAGELRFDAIKSQGAISQTLSAYTPQPRAHTGPDCGIKLYNARSSAICGVSGFNSGRGPVCGVEQYNQGSSAVCGEDCRSKCKRRNIFKQCTKRETTCTYRVCRDSSFGVERYKHCTDPSFGVSGYKICRHESFGVESYNTCQLLKTTHELNAFVANTKERIPEYAGLYALHQGQVLSTIGLKNDMACLIRGYGNRPLHGQIVADLSEKYTIHFLENYRDNPVDCSERVSSEELANFNDFCSQFTLEELNGVEDPSTQHIACRSKKSSLLISSWFQDKSSEIGALINDVVSRNNTQIRGELSSLSQMIETEPAFTE